ncbi:MBL fold metallo-hydrolase [Cryomorphaceae bacterium]|nr:MBL fold metallo-hydrolase [Cryomorphaceae bacterium]
MKILKKMGWILLIIVVLLVVGIAIFIKTAPQFGQSPKGADLERISESPNYGDGQFINLIETKMGSFGEMMGTMPEFIFGKNKAPKNPLPTKFDTAEAPESDTACYITWYGHSAFLIEMDGQRILIDPMLGKVAAPVSFGSKRWPYQQPIPLESITQIDAVILSHDHYDHLDYASIKLLKDRVGHFYTALGVGSHLKLWGVPEEKITELDWWQSATQGDLSFKATPARHFSGRGIGDQNKTQWASWVIRGTHQNLYFSGDGGYGPHFKEIGEKEGPFDLAMMECGQYNEAWHAIHMMPEESVQAGQEVGASLLMPIHWGAFTLAVHEWTDPIVRFKAAADTAEVTMIHPFIGERFQLGVDLPQEPWWVGVDDAN